VSRDEVFLRFAKGVFVVLILYGIGMMTVLVFGETSVGSKMLSAFSTMFAGAVGLGSGYLLGSRAVNGNGASDVGSPHE